MRLDEIIVNCGDTSNDPDAERAYRAIRVGKGDTTPAGCGKPVGLLHLYRCTDCARWLHHTCLLKHFAEHGDDIRLALAASQARVARLEEALALYADPKSYTVQVEQPVGNHVILHSFALMDCGQAAREALAPTEAAP